MGFLSHADRDLPQVIELIIVVIDRARRLSKANVGGWVSVVSWEPESLSSEDFLSLTPP